MASPTSLDPASPGHQLRRRDRVRLRARRRAAPTTVARQPPAGSAAAWSTSFRFSACPADSATATTSPRAGFWAIRFAIIWPTRLQQFKAAGKLILGICNGFQILLKSGVLLPLDARTVAPATLAWNDSGKFEDRWVPLYAAGTSRCFSPGIESMYLPVAHAEGKFVPRDARGLRRVGAQRPARAPLRPASPGRSRRRRDGRDRVSRQSQRLAGRRRRSVRRDRPRLRVDAASRTAHRSHATSALDARAACPRRATGCASFKTRSAIFADARMSCQRRRRIPTTGNMASAPP